MTETPQPPTHIPPVDIPDGGAMYYPGGKKPGRSKVAIVLLILLAILLVAAAGGAGWYFLIKPKPAPVAQTPAPTTPATPKDDIADSTEQKTFKSDVLMMQLTYPANWTAPTEKDGGITITSPDFPYKTTAGDATGNFRIYIRQGARDKDGKYIGAGAVTQPSEKLVYAKPGTTQRKDTNLSVFGAPTSDHFTFFMVTGDFQLKKDDQLGPNYGREADTYIIVGGYSAKGVADDLAFTNVPLDEATAKHVYTQAINIIKSIQLQ